MKLIELFEARRNPLKNIKYSPYEELEKYKDDPEIFISFTSVDKLGINPKSVYKETPNGIYAYPLKTVWKNFDHETKNIKGLYKDYEDNIYIFKSKCNLTDVEKYDESDFEKDIKNIEKMIQSLQPFTDEQLEKKEKEYEKLAADLAAKIKTVKDFETETRLTKELMAIISKMDTITKRKPYINNSKDELLRTLDIWKHSTRKPTIKKLFLMTKELAELLTVTNDTTVWNSLLQKLGHCGFVDYGNGIIHRNEKAQAVFLSKKYIQVIDRIKNRQQQSQEHTIRKLKHYAKTGVYIPPNYSPMDIADIDSRYANDLVDIARLSVGRYKPVEDIISRLSRMTMRGTLATNTLEKIKKLYRG